MVVDSELRTAASVAIVISSFPPGGEALGDCGGGGSDDLFFLKSDLSFMVLYIINIDANPSAPYVTIRLMMVDGDDLEIFVTISIRGWIGLDERQHSTSIHIPRTILNN